MKDVARWLALAAVVAVGAFLRFDALHEPSYWLDEILYEQLTHTAAGQAWWQWIAGSHAEHGGLYFATQLFMPGRVAAALFGVATLGMLWLIATRIDRRSAIAGAVLLAVSPLHVYYSREARSYALLMLLTAALILVLLRGRSLLAYCLVLVAMLYTAALAAPVVIAAGLVAAGCALLTKERWYWRAAIASAVTVALFRFVYTARPYEGQGWPAFPPIDIELFDALLRTFTVSATGERIGLRVAVTMLLLAIAGAVTVVRRDRRAALVLIGMTLLPMLGALASLWLFDHFFAARYLTPALVGFILLAAAGLAAIVRYEAAAVLVAAIIGWQTWPTLRNEPFQKLDWRQVAQTIWQHSQPGDVVIAAEPWSEVSLRYYLDRLPPRVKLGQAYSRVIADGHRRLHQARWFVTAGFNPDSESRIWMCGFPVVLGSSLEDFRLHYASVYVEANAPWLHSDGWANPEGTFRWATATRSTITIPRWSRRDDTFTMRAIPSTAGQTMRVSLNGHFIADTAMPHRWTDYTFSAPARMWIDGENTLTFDFAFVRVPGGDDQRPLAAAFENIRIGGPFARLPALIDARTVWRNSETNFSPERLNRDAVMALIARLGFDPQTTWPLLERGEVRLENLAETVTWGEDCQSDRAFLETTFAALLNRAPAPHEVKELLALPRARIPGRIVKWPEFRDAVVKR